MPGEELSISAGSSAWMKRTVDARAATSWSSGRLVFREARLGGRVGASESLRRDESSSRGFVVGAICDVSGNFVTGDSEAVVAAFAAVLPLEIADGGDELLLFRAQSERR